jgi:nicotinamidase-related amidase
MVNTHNLAQAKDSILVVIDVQRKLVDAMPTGTRERVIDQIDVLLQAIHTLNIPAVATEQYPKGLGETEPRLMDKLADAPVIEKTCFSCAQAAGFLDVLHNLQRQQLVLVGMETHICVLQTALDLQSQGYQVFVVEDAVSSRTKPNQYNGLQRMRQDGIIVTNTESVLFEWLEDAKYPEFKNLASLII